jgi:hypothetical protein
MSRNGTSEKVGAIQPRMTMQTNPLLPSEATWYPLAVSIFTVARAEMFSGAALLANVISSSCVIKARQQRKEYQSFHFGISFSQNIFLPAITAPGR